MQYLLVHGSWQGSWCWEKLVPHLEKKGHLVECIDLPSYAPNTPSITYQDYYDHLEKTLNRYAQPVILVAHSMSGIIVGPLADKYPQIVKHVFFIAAFLPSFEESLFDLAFKYEGSQIPTILQTDPINQIQTVDLQKAKEVFYHECSEEVKQWAIERLCPQPMLPLQTPLDWDDRGRTKEKRTYIVCEQDRDVPLDLQLDCIKNHPCKEVRLPCGHFPFLSQPETIANILASLVTKL